MLEFLDNLGAELEPVTKRTHTVPVSHEVFLSLESFPWESHTSSKYLINAWVCLFFYAYVE